MELRCPVCAGDLAGGEPVMVCASCHRMLGGVSARATGEFTVPTASALAAAAPELADVPAGVERCAWCGKGHAEVKKILTSTAVGICNECVALCVDILTAELGDDWH